MKTTGQNAHQAPVQEPALKSSPLFADLSGLEFNAVSAFLEPRQVKSGEAIFMEGAAGEEMYVFVSGKLDSWVNQADGSRRRMFEFHPGDFFGEMSIIANEGRSATLIAQADSQLYVMHAIDFYRIIYEHPIIGAKMLNAIRRVQNTWLSETSKYLGDLMRWGETARRRAICDELTGLYNRRFLDESAASHFKQSPAGFRSTSVLMMDLDKIHEVNNAYGTKAGDDVFNTTADVLRSVLRSGDIAARLAGDEFGVLLPDTGPEEALAIAETIRRTMFSRKTIVPKAYGVGTAELSVYISIGVASAPHHADNWEDLCKLADEALMRCKKMGRNRVVLTKAAKK